MVKWEGEGWSNEQVQIIEMKMVRAVQVNSKVYN